MSTLNIQFLGNAAILFTLKRDALFCRSTTVLADGSNHVRRRGARWRLLRLQLLSSTMLLGACSHAQIVVGELAHMIRSKEIGTVVGSIAIDAKQFDCRRFAASVNVVQNGGSASKSQLEVFLEGAILLISGRACFAVNQNEYEMRSDLQHRGNMQVLEDRVVFDGPVSKTGTVEFRVDKMARVVVLESVGDEPLKFLIERHGLAYLSGLGKYRTPDGTVRELR